MGELTEAYLINKVFDEYKNIAEVDNIAHIEAKANQLQIGHMQWKDRSLWPKPNEVNFDFSSLDIPLNIKKLLSE